MSVLAIDGRRGEMLLAHLERTLRREPLRLRGRVSDACGEFLAATVRNLGSQNLGRMTERQSPDRPAIAAMAQSRDSHH